MKKSELNNSKHLDTITMWLIFSLALLLRLIWIQQYQSSPMFDFPLLDFTHFDHRAREILSGQWFSENYLFNPLYPLFLSFVYKVFGTDLFFPRLLQAIFGAVGVLLVYRISSSFFNRRTAVISAVLAASYSPLIYYDGLLMATSLITFLLLLVVWLLLKSMDTKSMLCVFLAGIAMGFIVLGRPNFLLVAVMLIPWLAVNGNPKRMLPQVLRCSLFVLSIGLVISPITVHHLIQDHEFVLVARHGGINFYIGNHAEATGAYKSIPGVSDTPGKQILDSHKIACQKLGRELSSSEVSSYWMNQSFHFIKTQPGKAAKLILRKIALFWGNKELPSEYSIDFDRKFHWFLAMPFPKFATIAPFAILGLIILSRKQLKALDRSFVLLILVFSVMISVVLFFVHARYRMAVTPWLCILAGVTADDILSRIRNRSWQELISIAVCLVLAGTFCAWPFLPASENPHTEELPGYSNLAYAYYRQGKFNESEHYLRYILEISESSKARYLLGQILLNRSDHLEAEKQLRVAISNDPSQIDAILSLAALLNASERSREAMNLTKSAMVFHPDDDRLKYNLAVMLYEQKKFAESLDVIRNVSFHAGDKFEGQVRNLRRQIEEEITRFNSDTQEGQVITK